MNLLTAFLRHFTHRGHNKSVQREHKTKQLVGDELRLQQHRQSCIQAYHAKALLISGPRPGSNTLSGIPEEWK